MSLVTNVILTAELGDEGAGEKISDALIERDFPALLPVHQVWSATRRAKAMEALVWTGAFNYFMPTKEFVELVYRTKWYHPGAVRLLVQRQEEDGFSLIPLPALAGGA